jgi:hypothetical protein
LGDFCTRGLQPPCPPPPLNTAVFTFKTFFVFGSTMGNTHSGKSRKSLEKPRFLGIPRKFSSRHTTLGKRMCTYKHYGSREKMSIFSKFEHCRYDTIIYEYCKINYFHRDFVFVILCLCESKINVFGRVVIENPLNIFIFAGFIFTITTPSRK